MKDIDENKEFYFGFKLDRNNSEDNKKIEKLNEAIEGKYRDIIIKNDTHYYDIGFAKQLKEMNRFDINKNTFINETQTEMSAKINIWSFWKANIRYIEILKNKDLYEFSTQEIINILDTLPTSSWSRKSFALTFINQYCEWACSVKGLINVNPCLGIDKDEVTKVNRTALENKIISLKEFYQIIKEIAYKTTWQNVAPLLLARYGITGKGMKYMINLKFKDIDRDNKKVYIIENDKVITSLEVDSDFIECIDIIEEENNYSQYVIEESKSYASINLDTRITAQGIYGRVSQGFASIDMKRISFNDLLKARKIEKLLEVRRTKILNTNDIKDVIKIFNPESISPGVYTALKNDYETLTGDKVVSANTKKNLHEDGNELVDKIIEKLGL
jgi:integrase